MKRVTRKETIGIGNDAQCLTVPKKREESDEKDLFSLTPLDLKFKILMKLPAKSIAQLSFVSKFWSSICRGKEFTALYLTQSSTRRRLLLVVNRLEGQLFHSYSQEDPFSDNHRVSVTQNLSPLRVICPPINGLICGQNGKVMIGNPRTVMIGNPSTKVMIGNPRTVMLGNPGTKMRLGTPIMCYDTKVMIGNPSTGQFVTLPRVKNSKNDIYTYFGYDPINDVYKVLCMTVLCPSYKRGSPVVSEEHQVFTLGAKQEWRMIECKHPHLPERTEGLCMNGVVYYLAEINYKECPFLMSFDLISEEFSVIKAPADSMDPFFSYLVNYNGKLALASVSADGTLDLWVLEDASKQEWSETSILVPSWRDLVGQYKFWFRGTLSTGELIFAPCPSSKPFFFLTYDLKENNVRKVVFEGINTINEFCATEAFFDHVESPMFLPKVI